MNSSPFSGKTKKKALKYRLFYSKIVEELCKHILKEEKSNGNSRRF